MVKVVAAKESGISGLDSNVLALMCTAIISSRIRAHSLASSSSAGKVVRPYTVASVTSMSYNREKECHCGGS